MHGKCGKMAHNQAVLSLVHNTSRRLRRVQRGYLFSLKKPGEVQRNMPSENATG